ncbi:hypothetical protein LSM04_005991 [Trypanosoma melophagium]|nr:hypothetical protein LSM04_005991 [Trypanosoma melophagium]
MDEADLLGHRIGIMSKGRLQCSGSSMFLKSKLGAGYLMTISVLAHADRQAMEELVRSHVESAESVGSGAGEIAFRLPMDKKDKFAGLLSDLETRGNSLGVCSYSLSVTTLEEIFIKIAEAASMQASSNGETESNTPVDAEQCVWNVNLIQREREIMRTQFSALMAKRLWNSLRDRRTQFFQIVCPVVCVLLAMLLTLIKFFDSPTLVLSNNLYGTDVQVDVANCDAVFDLSVPFSPTQRRAWYPALRQVLSLRTYCQRTTHTVWNGMVPFPAATPPLGCHHDFLQYIVVTRGCDWRCEFLQRNPLQSESCGQTNGDPCANSPKDSTGGDC